MKNIRRFWIIAGEASGDMYGARLAKELQSLGSVNGDDVRISGMGGPAMIAAELDIRVDSTELGVVGLIEVLKHLLLFIRIFLKLTRQAIKERPEAVILIDYPGFNLLFAIVMHMHRIPVIWYVCPQLWVWGKWRLPILAKICSKMLVIFPFEVEIFAHTKLKAEFVGHPLLDLERENHDPSVRRDPNCFLLLPGSRTMEVTRLMPPILDTVRELSAKHPQLRFVLSAPREKIASLCRQIYMKQRAVHPHMPVITFAVGETARYQQLAAAGIAASGTVTVESALAGLPLVVVYRLHPITFVLASLAVRLYRKSFTMVNIIANREIFEEFLQWRVRADRLVPAIERILPGGVRRAEVEQGMRDVAQLLAPRSRSAIHQAAEACLGTAGKP